MRRWERLPPVPWPAAPAMIYCARDADKCGREIFRHAGRGGYPPRWRENANHRRRCFRSAAGETCAAAHINPPWLSGLGWMPRTEASKAGCMGFTRWKPLFAAGRVLRGRRMFRSCCVSSVPPKARTTQGAFRGAAHAAAAYAVAGRRHISLNAVRCSNSTEPSAWVFSIPAFAHATQRSAAAPRFIPIGQHG